MMRQWYFVEMHDGYSLTEAERICNLVINDKRFGVRYRAEFYAKLGECLYRQGKPHRNIDLERCLKLFRQSLDAYFESAWYGRESPGLDRNLHLEWLERAAVEFVRAANEDIQHLFAFIESLAAKSHDIDLESIRILVEPLEILKYDSRANIRRKAGGLANRGAAAIRKAAMRMGHPEGLTYTADRLGRLAADLEG